MYNYLNDFEFLNEMDTYPIKTNYVRIDILDFKEE
jgi:hypothetical protein